MFLKNKAKSLGKKMKLFSYKKFFVKITKCLQKIFCNLTKKLFQLSLTISLFLCLQFSQLSLQSLKTLDNQPTTSTNLVKINKLRSIDLEMSNKPRQHIRIFMEELITDKNNNLQLKLQSPNLNKVLGLRGGKQPQPLRKRLIMASNNS